MAVAPTSRAQDQGPVHQGVGHLAERAHLVEMPGDVTVEAVGESRGPEKKGGRQPSLPVRLGEQDDEGGQAGQPQGAQRVGDGEDTVLALAPPPTGIRPRSLASPRA